MSLGILSTALDVLSSSLEFLSTTYSILSMTATYTALLPVTCHPETLNQEVQAIGPAEKDLIDDIKAKNLLPSRGAGFLSSIFGVLFTYKAFFDQHFFKSLHNLRVIMGTRELF